MTDCRHGREQTTLYGVGRCFTCGAIHGFDGRWRHVMHDPETQKVTITLESERIEL